jgi:hypothetical protein
MSMHMRRGRKRKRPPLHRDYRPEQREFWSRRAKGAKYANLRVPQRAVSREELSASSSNGQYSTECDQRHYGSAEAHGDGHDPHIEIPLQGGHQSERLH